MLYPSKINVFDSQEARPYKNDPEIVVMTILVQHFHDKEIKKFESVLRRKEGKVRFVLSEERSDSFYFVAQRQLLSRSTNKHSQHRSSSTTPSSRRTWTTSSETSAPR